MREILFRGKDIAGNWHYGVPLIFTDDYVCITKPYTYNKSVIPETIGQYTGLTANGKKIFEGDIVKCKDCLEPKKLEFQGYIDFKNGSFVIFDDFMTHYRWLDYEVEVIGNIHDNPELLKPSLKPEYLDGDPDRPICPNCRTPLNEMEDCDCGQKIDWSEEE